MARWRAWAQGVAGVFCGVSLSMGAVAEEKKAPAESCRSVAASLLAGSESPVLFVEQKAGEGPGATSISGARAGAAEPPILVAADPQLLSTGDALAKALQLPGAVWQAPVPLAVPRASAAGCPQL